MAARRNRIKGIANIPVRRKASISSNQELQTEISSKEEQKVDKETTELKKACNDKIKIVAAEKPSCKPDSAIQNNITSDCTTESINTSKEKVNETVETQKSAVPLRRRFVKPTVSLNLLNRSCKTAVKTISNEGSLKVPENETLTQTSETTILAAVDVDSNESKSQEIPLIKVTTIEPIKIRYPEVVNVTLNETAILPSNANDTDNNSFQGIRKIPPSSLCDYRSGSDTEYSGSIASPNKMLNRSRIKAVPRFGQRRTSFSASESEDDNRRTCNRIRNDSVCSAASGIQEQQTNIEVVGVPRKEFSSVIQRKCKRTEQSRKLAEARREFQLKFGDAKPDKHKLTMIDLIFYNPTTNPMSQKRKRNLSTNEEQEKQITEKDVEENVDDPNHSDEENELPAPQIKIGANGEIMIDEKSLVIENKETKKNREELQKSEVIDGDFDTSYGVYKRVKRSKDWSQAETLRFYKALNTIGTDFTLMCELFPRRSRRELKMKFKKEERMNRSLVDRAVMQPKNFDLTELIHEVEVEERELVEEQKRKEDKKINTKTNLKEKKKRKPGSLLAREFEIESAPCTKVSKDSLLVSDNSNKTIESMLNHERNLHRNIRPRHRDTDSDDNNDDSDSADEVLSTPKPTRSGRIPKLRKKRKIILDNEPPENKSAKLEPGSIMIVSTKGNTGEPVYKVYMVTPGQDKTPLHLTSDILDNLIKSVDDNTSTVGGDGVNVTNIVTISAQETNSADNEECNITIPAEENSAVKNLEVEETSKSCEEGNFISSTIEKDYIMDKLKQMHSPDER